MQQPFVVMFSPGMFIANASDKLLLDQGHIRLVLLPIVYNLMAARKEFWCLPFFIALENAMQCSSYFPLVHKRRFSGNLEQSRYYETSLKARWELRLTSLCKPSTKLSSQNVNQWNGSGMWCPFLCIDQIASANFQYPMQFLSWNIAFRSVRRDLYRKPSCLSQRLLRHGLVYLLSVICFGAMSTFQASPCMINCTSQSDRCQDREPQCISGHVALIHSRWGQQYFLQVSWCILIMAMMVCRHSDSEPLFCGPKRLVDTVNKYMDASIEPISKRARKNQCQGIEDLQLVNIVRTKVGMIANYRE